MSIGKKREYDMGDLLDTASRYLVATKQYFSNYSAAPLLWFFSETLFGNFVAVLIGAFLLKFLVRSIFYRKSSVKGKNVFITGGSTGIGFSIALEYAKLGANVCIFARTESKLVAAKEKLLEACSSSGNSGSHVEYVCMDVTSYESVKDAFDEAAIVVGEPDVLVTAAGQAFPGYFLDQDPSVFEKTMRLNYMGNVHSIKAAIPYMVQRKSGNICIIASATSCVSFIGYSSYAPTKFALRGLADSLRSEMNGFGVAVSIAYPPDTDTPGFKIENEKKPKETLACFPADPYSAESVAQSCVDGIRLGDYHIQSPDFLQNLLISSMSGVTPRAYTIFEILFLPIISLVEVPFYMWFDYQARTYANRVIAEDKKKQD